MKKFALVAGTICFGFTGCDNKGAATGGTSGGAKAGSSSATPSATVTAKPAPTGPGGTGAK